MYNRVEYQNIGRQNGINVDFGTVLEGDAPKVILIRCKGRMKPIIKKTTYEEEINELKNDINGIITSKVRGSKSFMNECLANTEISSRSIKFGKYSFVKYDVYVKPCELNTISSYKTNVSKLTNDINLSISERIEGNFKLKTD